MKKTGIIVTAAVLLAMGTGAAATQLHIKPSKIETFSSDVKTVEEITVPENVRIVALGEAAHGNKEFQELKLSVFKRLVETTNVRGLILEGDFGGCAQANDYINGGAGTAEEVTAKLGYGIYRTDDMCELVQWMHDYNEKAAEGDKVRLYGADIQNSFWNIEFIKRFYEQAAPDKAADISAKFDNVFGTEEYVYDLSVPYEQKEALVDEIAADMDANRADYEAKAGKEKFSYARRADDAIKCYIMLKEKEQNYNLFRDTKMKENVDWALGIEENDHDAKLMLECHNGHMTKNRSSAFTYMGNMLYKEYGEDYFAIGTDFYITNDNLPTNEGRAVKKFISDDPLAYQVGEMDGNEYYLDFSEVSDDDPIHDIINKPMKTGSLGEGYNILTRVLKNAYQINYAPADMYDAMIFVYEAEPIEIWEKTE